MSKRSKYKKTKHKKQNYNKKAIGFRPVNTNGLVRWKPIFNWEAFDQYPDAKVKAGVVRPPPPVAVIPLSESERQEQISNYLSQKGATIIPSILPEEKINARRRKRPRSARGKMK